jgi:hypothetical protein
MKAMAKSLKLHLSIATLADQPLGAWIANNVTIKDEREALLSLVNQDRHRLSKYKRSETLFWLMRIVIPALEEYETAAIKLSLAYKRMQGRTPQIKTQKAQAQVSDYQGYVRAVKHYGDLKAQTARLKDKYLKAKVPPEQWRIEKRMKDEAKAVQMASIEKLSSRDNLTTTGWKRRVKNLHGEDTAFTEVRQLIGRHQKVVEWIAKKDQQVVGVYEPLKTTCWVMEMGEPKSYSGKNGVLIHRKSQGKSITSPEGTPTIPSLSSSA